MSTLLVVLQDTPAGPATTLKVQLTPVLQGSMNISDDVQEDRVIPGRVYEGWGMLPIVGDTPQIIQDLDP